MYEYGFSCVYVHLHVQSVHHRAERHRDHELHHMTLIMLFYIVYF